MRGRLSPAQLARLSDQETPGRRLARKIRALSSDAEHPLVGLQGAVGNAAVARMVQRRLSGGRGLPGPVRLVQRVSVGTPPDPKPTKQWEVLGGFASKHLVAGGLTEAAARDKWKERYKRDKTWRNTVVAQDSLEAAISAGKVTGAYPAPRTEQRNPMVVTVDAFTVIGRNQNGAKVPGQAVQLTQIGVVGNATEGIYFPDHLEGSLSR